MFLCAKKYFFLVKILLIFFFIYGCSVDPSLLPNKSVKLNIYKQKSGPKLLNSVMITVKPNDTLYSISNTYNISIEEIKEINNLGEQSIIKVGQKLFISNENKIIKSNNTFNIAQPVMKPFKKEKYLKNKPDFIWPISGSLLNKFGIQKNGIHNDGINILASIGDPVLSSSFGKVLFVGKNLKGLGSMILIKHENNWISSYAHLSEIFVTEGEQVKTGQIIGQVGDTGRVTIPQLYFEIRNNEKPINPEIILSS